MVRLLPYILWLCQNLWLAGSSLPSERSYAECWVRGGHWCKEWHLNKKHIPGAGWHFLYTYQIRGLSRSPQAPPLLPQAIPSWLMGTVVRKLDGYQAEESASTQQMSLSPSRAVLPQVQQRCYTSGNNSHVLGDPAVRITVNWLWESHNCVLGSAQTPSEWNKSH